MRDLLMRLLIAAFVRSSLIFFIYSSSSLLSSFPLVSGPAFESPLAGRSIMLIEWENFDIERLMDICDLLIDKLPDFLLLARNFAITPLAAPRVLFVLVLLVLFGFLGLLSTF